MDFINVKYFWGKLISVLDENEPIFQFHMNWVLNEYQKHWRFLNLYTIPEHLYFTCKASVTGVLIS